MPNRREFLRDVVSATAGLVCAGGGLAEGVTQSGGTVGRRQVMLGGRRITTVDVHGHCYVDVRNMVAKHEWARALRSQLAHPGCKAIPCWGPDERGPWGVNAERGGWNAHRVRLMDQLGVDVHALSVNPYWYPAEQGLARELIQAQNEKLAAACKAYPDRFVAFATVALQYPEMAADQLEQAVKKLGLRGAAIGCNVNGEELGSPRFDPFWAKAQELNVLLYLHPQPEGSFDGSRYPAVTRKLLEGSGNLGNVIGNPLETTIALSHMIFEGTFDRFPGLKICGAHGGGFLPAYIGRSDASCTWTPRCKPLKKLPSEYFKDQIYCDSLVFSHHLLRYLVAQHGVSQVVFGSDFPAGWPTKYVDDVLEVDGLSDADKGAILGDNLTKLLRIET